MISDNLVSSSDDLSASVSSFHAFIPIFFHSPCGHLYHLCYPCSDSRAYSPKGINPNNRVCKPTANHDPLNPHPRRRRTNIGRRVPGFTLVEQILIMALTTILILIGFTAVMNFQQLITKVRNNAQSDRDIYLFTNVLQNDFTRSENILWDGELKIKKPEEVIKYQFGKEYILRETEALTDTFKFYANDLSVVESEVNSGLVEELSFNLVSNAESYRKNFIKKYPEYIKWEYKEYGN